jgi:hypothetical protein
MNSLRVRSVAESQRKVPRLKLAGLKRSVAMPTLRLTWEKSGQPKISDEVYRNEIQPRLASVAIPTIMSALNVCASYATFEEGDAALILGIGEISRGSLVSRQRRAHEQG